MHFSIPFTGHWLFSLAPLSACLAGANNRTEQNPHHQQLTHSDFRHHSSASLQSLHNPGAGHPTTPPACDDLSQVSLETHNMGGTSHSGTKQPPQMLPQSVAKKKSKAYSLTNNFERPYFTVPSWSFEAPTASIAETLIDSKPISTSHETSGLGRRDLASANMTHTGSSSLFPGPRLLRRPTTAELMDDDDSADDEDLALWMVQDAEDEIRRSSLAGSDSKAAISRRLSVIPRNLPITSPFVILDKFTYNGIQLAEKVYVELKDKDFLRIVHIIQDTSTSAITLRGWKFRRTRELNGVIDRKLNEVCWILHVDDDDPRDTKLQGMETVPVRDIVKRRRIRLTNQSFPALSWREDEKKESPGTIESDRVLVCRFKYLCFYANAKARTDYEWHEKGFHRIREDECDQRPDNGMKDEELRSIWRGYTEPGGSQEGFLPGEKEFLRQEEVSHKGIASRASLKAPSGPDFPMGDPMKRGSVGSLVTQIDLQQNPEGTTQGIKPESNDPAHMDPTTRSNDVVGGVPISPISRLRGKSQFEFTGFKDPLTVSSDCDTHDDDAISTWRRGLRQSSIQPRESSHRSPRIVEIDAHVKTSSSSGIYEKRYEGRVTSTYYPAPPLARRKRSADVPLDSANRPTKKIDRGFRADSSKANLRNRHNGQEYHQESASSDSERTLGRSQSPDSVEEMCAQSIRACYKTPISGHRTPVSRRKDSTLWRYGDTMLRPTKDGFTNYVQASTPLTGSVRSSVVNKTHDYGKTEHDNDIVDLTRPQANPYRSLSRAGHSISRQSGPSDPLNARSDLSSSDKSRSRHQNQNTTVKSPASKAHQKRYTFGDCFCGAGGMSRGAVSAGLRINWGFDFNQAACQTYQMNFFGTPIYNVWANEFSEAKGNHRVDICHLSPPCQFFSDAHTVQGKDDDMNTASLFAIFNLLEKAKPRIVTLEQTSGLIRRHPIFFNAVINMFTSRGFSVRWKVMNCADFGLPQRRMRLFVIASW